MSATKTKPSNAGFTCESHFRNPKQVGVCSRIHTQIHRILLHLSQSDCLVETNLNKMDRPHAAPPEPARECVSEDVRVRVCVRSRWLCNYKPIV